MPEKANYQREEFQVFLGMFSNVDPHDLEPGQAQLQVNVWSPREGELLTRGGLREMTYD